MTILTIINWASGVALPRYPQLSTVDSPQYKAYARADPNMDDLVQREQP